MFGNPETTTGGMALKFYSSVRMDIRRIEQLKDGNEVVGNRVRVKIVKNKVAPPFRQAEFDILFDGISRSGEILDYAIQYGLVEKSGAWFALTPEAGGQAGEKLGQGREAARAALEKDPKLQKSLADKIMKAREIALKGDQ